MFTFLCNFQFNFESLFRSLHYALMDNCCREYLFLVDFYMASGTASQDLFNAIMGKTLQTYLVCIGLMHKHVQTQHTCTLFITICLIWSQYNPAKFGHSVSSNCLVQASYI